MTLKSPLIVRVEMPGKTLGAAMSEVGSWLDIHKIQPAGFSNEPHPEGVAFDIWFAREHEAQLFEQAFTDFGRRWRSRESEPVEGGLR